MDNGWLRQPCLTCQGWVCYRADWAVRPRHCRRCRLKRLDLRGLLQSFLKNPAVLDVPPGIASQRSAARAARLEKVKRALASTRGSPSELVEAAYVDRELGDIALSLAKTQQAKARRTHLPKRRIRFVSGGRCSPR